MATSVHLPKQLLSAVDRRARSLKISRNQLIRLALERELAGDHGWSEGFFEALADVDAATKQAVDELTREVASRRSSKRPLKL